MLDGQWEDEASTTVEEGNGHDRLRALGANPKPAAALRRPITGVSTSLDEPTLDDQRESPALGLTPAPSSVDVARLVITQGSDLGRNVEIHPGTTYTIGRGLDNDFVLTDISVSRKHFDLRHENGAWIIVDRGSGNGTLVNGNVEDAPFMLANGDTIEIGNTAFRFEQTTAAHRAASADDEMSTVAGKPLRIDGPDAPTPFEAPLPRLEPSSGAERERAAPLPPPSMRPTIGAAPYQPVAAAMAASTLPLPQMANRPPILEPGQPTMLEPNAGIHPTTLPGQGLMRPSGYPQASEIPPHSVHAQMLQITAQPGRADPATALVAPAPYHAPPAGMELRQYVQPQLSKRAKLLLAAAAVSAVAAIATIAALKSGTAKGSAKASQPASIGSGERAGSEAPAITPAQAPPVGSPTPPAPTPATQAASIAPPPAAPVQDPPKPDPPKQDPPKRDPPKPDPPKQDPAKQDLAKQDSKKPPPPPPAPSAAPTARSKKPPAPSAPSVATADVESARSRADEAYRTRRFSDASNIMAAAARGAPEDEAKQLRHRADLYASFARAYNAGTAPGVKATEAYAKLQQAANYDNGLSRAFDADISSRLAQVAPKAAIQFIAQKDYKSARLAVLKAESVGAGGETVKIVRQALDGRANDLYNQAKGEAQSDPDAAKDKCRTILDIVDPSSGTGAKAKKLLAQLSK
jgi:hypothetical protein